MDAIPTQHMIPEPLEKERNWALEGSSFEVVSARPDWVEVLVVCELQAAERAHEFFMQLIAHLAAETRDAVGLALRELLFNAVEWGGKCDPNCAVRIVFVRGRRMLLYRIADPGPGFSFTDLPHSALSNPERNPNEHMSTRDRRGLRPGGFGIMLARAMVDELSYNEAQNEVQFVKYLD